MDPLLDISCCFLGVISILPFLCLLPGCQCRSSFVCDACLVYAACRMSTLRAIVQHILVFLPRHGLNYLFLSPPPRSLPARLSTPTQRCMPLRAPCRRTLRMARRGTTWRPCEWPRGLRGDSPLERHGGCSLRDQPPVGKGVMHEPPRGHGREGRCGATSQLCQ